MVVGDAPYDAEAARTLALGGIGLLCGGFPEAALRQAGFTAIYRDSRHLLDEYEASPLAGA